MITFETEEDLESAPVFSDVGINQLFVNNDGFLCQKVTEITYNCIATARNTPYADHVEAVPLSKAIRKILPRITKINF